ncbi:MAG TPA: nitrogen regulation protein NR(I) [Thermoplasmata archaeon]|nr:nitrogen regulation protein NR(I) [Thermoplasmata archaeon]
MAEALRRLGHVCTIVHGLSSAVEQVRREPFDLVITDLRMPGMDGMQFFVRIHATQATLPVIILTAHGTIPDAVAATRRGVFGFLTKPFDAKELLAQVEQAIRLSSGGPETKASNEWRAEIVTCSHTIEEVLRQAQLVATSDASVLITGDSGSGKELLAKAIHNASPRARGPFQAINCAAIPEHLLESELFGHAKGAFSGAINAHKGLFQAAGGGTLFLDEIGDMPAELQTRLLRVLSDGTFYRVGGHQQIKANVRIIAATHQDLETRVREGAFREDLYHRLNVIRVRMPALRERREDIPLLARHFLARSAKQLGVEPKRLSETVLEYLGRLDFPGNVRQLENLCHWLTVMAPGQTIELGDLPAEFRAQPAPGAKADWLEALAEEVERRLARGESGILEALGKQFERLLIVRALARSGGRRIEAANLLGMGRNTITRKIQELGIEDAGEAEK